MQQEKIDDKFVEEADTRFNGLSSDDADLMRRYNGAAGKKVVRKVSYIHQCLTFVVCDPC